LVSAIACLSNEAIRLASASTKPSSSASGSNRPADLRLVRVRQRADNGTTYPIGTGYRNHFHAWRRRSRLCQALQSSVDDQEKALSDYKLYVAERYASQEFLERSEAGDH
jgi:hypothetical protein